MIKNLTSYKSSSLIFLSVQDFAVMAIIQEAYAFLVLW